MTVEKQLGDSPESPCHEGELGQVLMNLISNAGAVAGQVFFHLHLHLVPRYADDPGMRALFDRDTTIDLDEVQAALSS